MDRILASPGLSFLATDIFSHVDLDTFSRLELVCKSWRKQMIVDQLWKRRLFSEVAPINTPQRIQVETRCKHLREILESGDLHRISRYCRRLCYRLKRRGFCDLWLDHANNPEVIGLPKTEFIRDMDVNENKIVCAIENDIIVYSRNQIFSESRPPTILHHLRGAHHRSLICLSQSPELIVAGGRDRKVSFWDAKTGQRLAVERDAHKSLISSLVVKKDKLFTASRDNTCKEWNLFPTANLSCDFALPRDEAYAHSSVWAVDANERFVVYGTQDCYVVVRDGLLGTRANMKGHFMAVRAVRILESHNTLAVTGDVHGFLNVFDLEEKHHLYTAPFQDGGTSEQMLIDGSVVKISECPSSGFLAVLYLNKLVVLHSLCDVKNSLSVDRVLRLGELIPNGIMRSISVTQNEIFVGTFNGIKGLFVINIWEGEEESKEEPMRLNEDLDWMY